MFGLLKMSLSYMQLNDYIIIVINTIVNNAFVVIRIKNTFNVILWELFRTVHMFLHARLSGFWGFGF